MTTTSQRPNRLGTWVRDPKGDEIERPPLCLFGTRSHHTRLGPQSGGKVPAYCVKCEQRWTVMTVEFWAADPFNAGGMIEPGEARTWVMPL